MPYIIRPEFVDELLDAFAKSYAARALDEDEDEDEDEDPARKGGLAAPLSGPIPPFSDAAGGAYQPQRRLSVIPGKQF